MKISSWLFLPLVSASLIPRQNADGPPATCLDVCALSALADSTTNPRCNLDDPTCLCADDGWATSLTKCINQICPVNVVGNLFYALKESCKRAGSPLHSEPSYGWTLTEPAAPSETGSETVSTTLSYDVATLFPGRPGPEASASALSSAIAAASSVFTGTTWATGNPTATGTSGTSSGAAVGLAPAVAMGAMIGLVGVGLVL